MTTIRDEIEAWARKVKSDSRVARNTEALNAFQEALQELQGRPWMDLMIQKDMQIKSPAEALGSGDQQE